MPEPAGRAVAVIAAGVVVGLLGHLCQQEVVAQTGVRASDPITPRNIGERADVPWLPVDAEPDWVQTLPVTNAQLHFVLQGIGSDPNRAQTQCERDALPEAFLVLRDHLAPSLGLATTDTVARAVLEHTVLVEAASGRVATRNLGRRGMNHGIAWCLWCVDVRAAVAKIDLADRGRVEWLLSRPLVPWQELKHPPEELGAPAPVRGFFRLHLSRDAPTFELARERSLTQVRDAFAARLRKALGPVLGKTEIDAAIESGLRRLSPVSRDYHLDVEQPERHRVTTYELWEIPLAGILRDLPRERHAAIAKALGVEMD